MVAYSESDDSILTNRQHQESLIKQTAGTYLADVQAAAAMGPEDQPIVMLNCFATGRSQTTAIAQIATAMMS